MKEKSVPAFRKFLAQFQYVLVILLLIATLISANVIASNKTGTLTKNEMTLLTVVTVGGPLI
ncbi:cation-transporting P-type ATPase [Methanosarcina sp. Z-7115]|uniref:Cation-transporting P-type ATPase n=1 Tax=Methanosarcina baikalica TaxID=3073890 RepID=A0ABU2D0L1_9EURY|nr:cation-transporting P-type ATPase [Methanosarcina sp. Z-7115]MDR7665382.1 cation-transporting P-type ATPase [Methanosarcina sp. Z-7115]